MSIKDVKSFAGLIRSDFIEGRENISSIKEAKFWGKKIVLGAALFIRPIACALSIIFNIVILAPVTLVSFLLSKASCVGNSNEFKDMFLKSIYNALILNPLALVVRPVGSTFEIGNQIVSFVKGKIKA